MLAFIKKNISKSNLQKSTVQRMRGVAAVEFAIMLPILITLIFGIVEYGRMLYKYNTLVKSVRDGARYLSVYSSTDTANYPTHKTLAACIVVYGAKDSSDPNEDPCGGFPLVTGLKTTDVKFFQSTSTSGTVTVKLVTVTIQGFSLGYITGYFPNTLTFGDISNTMRQAES